MSAHVICQVNDSGASSIRNRMEWVVNGMVVSSVEMEIYPGQNFEIDVPENSSVRLDVAAIGSDGQMTWASSDTLYTGPAPMPVPVPVPAPGPPSVGNLSIAYWS